MEYIQLGNTGLEVSRICLGCMSFGEHEGSWKLGYEDSEKIIYYAIEQGINFFDTANVYSNGKSEEYLGKALQSAFKKGLITRDELVVATKVGLPMSRKPNKQRVSRKHIMQELDVSLERLQLDYVDVYLIHHVYPDTNLEEMMEALNDCVRSGKVHYIGVSHIDAWQMQKCQYIAKEHGWTPLKVFQTEYNLIARDAEFEHIPVCLDWGMGFTPNSPYASGRLVRTTATSRSQYDGTRHVNSRTDSYDQKVIQTIAKIASQKGVSNAEIVLAWDFSKKFMTSLIIGATKTKYIDQAVKSLELTLTEDEIHKLEEYCTPHREYK